MLALLFLISGTSKLFPLRYFELVLEHLGVDFLIGAAYLARLIIAVEIGLGLCILVIRDFRRFSFWASMVFLLIMDVFLIYQLSQGESGNCGCFGTLLAMSPLQSLLKNAFISVLLVFAYFGAKDYRNKLLPASLGLGTICLLFAFLLLFQPVRNERNNNHSDSSLVNINFERLDSLIPINRGPLLIGLFSSNCSKCIEVATSLSSLNLADFSIIPIKLVVTGSDSEVDKFLHLTYNTEKDVYRLSTIELIEIFNSGTPTLLYLEDGILKKRWTYKTYDKLKLVQFIEESRF